MPTLLESIKSIEDLETLIVEYIESIPDGMEESWYAEPRTFARSELARFVKYLREKTDANTT